MKNDVSVMIPRRLQSSKKTSPSVECFLVAMLFVIAVQIDALKEIIQGTYLAYVVGILTNLERRFGITSKQSGALLSFYDIGHTASVVLVGFMANGKHLPRITASGVILSAVSMFILALPMALFGSKSFDEASLSLHQAILQQEYILKNICDSSRVTDYLDQSCEHQKEEHFLAFCILVTGQILAGIAAAPFNTVAYVYVDNNLADKAKSPFYLSLLSSMYAFAPAFGFALSAGVTQLYTTIVDVPPNLTINSDGWIGAWWLGFIIFGLLYFAAAIPLFFFPEKLLQSDSNSFEMQQLRSGYSNDYDDYQTSALKDDEQSQEAFCEQLKAAFAKFPALIRNPVFTSAIIGWMFGSYLTGGYSTYLPKYIETQFGRSASAADIYSGIVSIGSIAVSTALGGYLLTKFNPSPRKALLFLIATWSTIVVTYLIGATVGCDEPKVTQLDSIERECNSDCHCDRVDLFNPVNYHSVNYFSPCHAGCQQYNSQLQRWDSCLCADDGPVESGLYVDECNSVFLYAAVMFTGLFLGNLFFMTTMMVVLRSVYDEEKVLALSFASCITNIMGFIPAPIIFGWIIDEDCLLWHSRCPQDHGNCVIYDNKAFRRDFHLTSAGFQCAEKAKHKGLGENGKWPMLVCDKTV
uniref:Solute carrier organic anion transporter family member n=1 Tax=Setaria digitata TaxID=48799 RepID=A0A915Q0B6_9BILA